MQTQTEKSETRKVINRAKLVDSVLFELQEPFSVKAQAMQLYSNKLDEKTKNAIMKEVSDMEYKQKKIIKKLRK
jgi:hypothetical protein